MSSKKVAVAISGGIDSSVAAALLKNRGFEIIGVTMQLGEDSVNWEYGGMQAIEDAKRVASKLGISHYVLNLKDSFEKEVIANFCEEYKKGKTPNPCIRCNKYIKFGVLKEKAKELGADYIATGHYARVEYDREKKRFLLKKGIDYKKDQSYVLCMMTQKQLEYTLLPLGNFTKQEIKQKAQELNLPVAKRAESQEICFIPDNDYGKFLKKYIPKKITPGPILNKEGKVIGEHRGIIFYTIGQRKGIGIADKQPLYVIAINRLSNTITVGKEKDALSSELVADDMNLIGIKKLKEPIKAEAKIRYLHPPSPATVIPLSKDKFKVKFDEPQWAITPGQAVVFYQKDIVIGGGKIIN